MVASRYGKTEERQSGVVSLLTVLFFMIFISILVVSYISMVLADMKQTTDSDLSASAFAAARGGVEDGKRLLIYCTSNPAAPVCTSIDDANSDKCIDLSALSSLKIQAATGDAAIYQQNVSCLSIRRNTPYVSANLSKTNDYIVPLRGVGAFSSLQVTWSGQGAASINGGSFSGWSKETDWTSPPVLVAQIIPYGNFSSLDTIETASHTVYIVPCASVCSAASVGFASSDIRGLYPDIRSGSAPVVYAPCMSVGGYSCTLKLSGFAFPATQYYARFMMVYGTTTDLQLSLKDNALATVEFNNVQPWIDSTGNTSDVFRRVRSQVKYGTNAYAPKYVLDSVAPVCKDMTVTSGAATSTYNCN